MADFNYIPNGGQTYIPFRENVHVPQPEFTPLGRPQPPLPDFQLTHEAQDKGWVVASPSHMISEAMVPGGPVFGGDGVQIFRLGLDYYPFTASLGHVIVEGTFNQKEELCDMTIHMWDGAPGGTVHYTCAIVNTRCTMPPDFVLADPGSAPSHRRGAGHPRRVRGQPLAGVSAHPVPPVGGPSGPQPECGLRSVCPVAGREDCVHP